MPVFTEPQGNSCGVSWTSSLSWSPGKLTGGMERLTVLIRSFPLVVLSRKFHGVLNGSDEELSTCARPR